MEHEDCCQLSAGLGRSTCSWCGASLERLYAGITPAAQALPQGAAARRRAWARERVRRAAMRLGVGVFTAHDLLPHCAVGVAAIERILREEALAGRLVEGMGSVVSAPAARRLYRALDRASSRD